MNLQSWNHIDNTWTDVAPDKVVGLLDLGVAAMVKDWEDWGTFTGEPKPTRETLLEYLESGYEMAYVSWQNRLRDGDKFYMVTFKCGHTEWNVKGMYERLCPKCLEIESSIT